MSEEVKRLQPTQAVLRELFLKSGNQCAFPGCCNLMVDEQGNFIGQVCHIEAAEVGGERFNPNMTNEERRAFDNLMLMCYEHHVVTNDVSKYTVAELKRMKKAHEDKFSNIIHKMLNTVVDYGKTHDYSKTNMCKKLSDVLRYGCTEEENTENSKILNGLLEKLFNLPIETRTLLSIMVNRSYKNEFRECCVPLHEIELTTGKDWLYILRQVEILKRRNILSDIDADEFGCPYSILCADNNTGWSYWNDIREFCKLTGIAIEEICVKLNFSLFD